MMRFPIRGGNWSNGSNAGLGALNLNNSRSNSNSNIGFRPALDLASYINLKGLCQCNIEKDEPSSGLPETQKKPVDASAGCLFEQLCDFDLLLKSAYMCRKGKAKKKATLLFFNNLEENIICLLNDLTWGSYKQSEYTNFFVFEPKRRLISAPNFRDRVLHRALYEILYPLFDKTFLDCSFACRVNKGSHAGADKAQSYIRKVSSENERVYALKADIRRYFSSIDHYVVKRILSEKIKCSRVLGLLFMIIDSSPVAEYGKGIPLGNLTSQLLANIYLHELDFYVKHVLRERHYVRYMDDFVIIHEDKAHLQNLRVVIEEFLNNNLKLFTNSKTQVFPISVVNGRSLDFLGYRIYKDHRFFRKNSVKKIKRSLRKMRSDFSSGLIGVEQIKPKIASWIGHASHADSNGLIETLLSEPFRRSHDV